MTDRTDQPTHFSASQSREIGELLSAGVDMLQREDAFHVGLLIHHHDSDEVKELGELRRAARNRFHQILNAVGETFDTLPS
ncbi:MAG: hypothetical protein WCG62_04930 [Actinomycetes bacterium]